MLEPLNDVADSGNYPFEDAIVYPREENLAGFGLTNLWEYEFTGFFDGVPEKEFEEHDKYDLLSIIGMAQTAVDWTSSSRIDKTFGKSLNLRYVMRLVAEIHQPMHNILRFSSDHPEGDDFGKEHKIKGDYNNLFELFEDAFGQYRSLNYPLSSDTQLSDYIDQIMKDYPKENFSTEIKNTDKSSWSKDSYDIAKDFAYKLEEGSAPSDEYLNRGKELVNKQLALAGYRLSALIKYMMSKQVKEMIKA